MTVEQTEQAVAEVMAEIDAPAQVDLHEDRTREVRTPGFSRMRTDWSGPDGQVVAHVLGIADNLVVQRFSSAYAVMHELWEIVREPVYNEATGEVLKDAHGFTVWRQNPSGGFIEDYSLLGHRERENLLFQITTNIFRWEQDAADLWGEAMFSKAQFEERFASTFAQAPGSRPTVDDRTQHARRSAADERYFAIFKSVVSRKADALVRSLTLLGQRLKDTA